MCRQTVQAIIKDLGDSGKMRVFNQVEELRDMLEMDPRVFDAIGETLFDNKRSLHSNTVIGKTEAIAPRMEGTVGHTVMPQSKFKVITGRAIVQLKQQMPLLARWTHDRDA